MTLSTELIRGKVANIISSREVALNVGKKHGVELGMLFDILSPGRIITDPDTNEQLGSTELPKVRVRISRVDDKFSVASTYRTMRVNVTGRGDILGLFQPPKWENRYETLKVGQSFESGAEDLDERDSYVSRGDKVIQVIDNDE